MAKALVGYLATTSPLDSREATVLRRRIADLESEVSRLKAENDALHTALSDDLARQLSAAGLLVPVTT